MYNTLLACILLLIRMIGGNKQPWAGAEINIARHLLKRERLQMINSWKLVIATLAVSAAAVTPAFAGILLGTPLSAILGNELGGALPFGEGAVLGLVAASVVAGVWIARRKS